MNIVTALEFRKKFGEVLDMAEKNQTVLIMRQNKPVAIVYPYEQKKKEYEDMQKDENGKKTIAMIAAWRSKWGKKQAKGPDSVTIIRTMRDSR